MQGYIVPECYFDTVLVRSILNSKEVLNHKKGCNNVINVLQKGALKDSFGIGIVDKDKRDLLYLEEFEKYEFDLLNLFKHHKKHHFIIQMNPPIEKWILEVAKEAKLKVSDFGLSEDIYDLKKITKSELASETWELKKLCLALIGSNSSTIKRLSTWIKYLEERKYSSDINHLING